MQKILIQSSGSLVAAAVGEPVDSFQLSPERRPAFATENASDAVPSLGLTTCPGCRFRQLFAQHIFGAECVNLNFSECECVSSSQTQCVNSISNHGKSGFVAVKISSVIIHRRWWRAVELDRATLSLLHFITTDGAREF